MGQLMEAIDAIDVLARHKAVADRLSCHVTALASERCDPVPFVRFLERELLPQTREDAALVERFVARIRESAARADSLEEGWEAHERVRRLAIELGEALGVYPGGTRNGGTTCECGSATTTP